VSTASLPQPLEGIRVLDLTHMTAGPMCTKLLADAGAEVIKVEPPGGEPTRQMPPQLEDDDGYVDGAFFLRLAAGKASVVLNLKQERAREALLRLVDACDVLVESFRPGTMARLGLDFETVHARNPGIVYVSVSGYGQPDVLDGPYAHRPAYDPIVQAMTGIAHVTGAPDGPPTVVGASIADTVPGMLGAYGAVLALELRRRTGVGTHVDVAQYDSMLLANDRNIAAYLLGRSDPPRGAPVPFRPYGLYPAADGHVVIGVVSDEQFRLFCSAIGRAELADDERARDTAARAANYDTFLGPIVEAWTSTRTRAEIVDQLLGAHIPCGPVQSPTDIEQDPQARVRMIRTVEHPRLGPLQLLGSPVKIGGLAEPTLAPPPVLGADTERVLREVAGLDDDELTELLP